MAPSLQPILLPGEEDRGLPLLRESPLSLDPTSPPRFISKLCQRKKKGRENAHDFKIQNLFSGVAQSLPPMFATHLQWQVMCHVVYYSFLLFPLKKSRVQNLEHPPHSDVSGEDGHTRNSSTTSQTGSAGYSSSQSSHGTTAQVDLHIEDYKVFKVESDSSFFSNQPPGPPSRHSSGDSSTHQR